MRTIRDESSDDSVAFHDVRVVRASAKALLVEIDGGQHWIPNSQVHDDSEIYLDADCEVQGSPGKLVLKRWICEQKGLVSA